MKKSHLSLLTFFGLFFSIICLTLVTAPPTSVSAMDTCSCAAPDGSCSASVTCQGGCTKTCKNNNNCWAECSGAYSIYGMEVTFEVQNATYPQLVAELSRLSGKDIVFTPTNPNTLFNAGAKRAPLWDALKILANDGTLLVGGADFEKLRTLRKILLSGERVTYGVSNTPLNVFVSDLSGLTGRTFRITSGRPLATVNVQLQNATLEEIIAAVAEQTGTKIVSGEGNHGQ
jgi:hypothetical protein